ncbi:MAG: hypothetical protein KGN84_12075, partial [Acidobacteriota bacterium]|nr:hypothetical protein [Acidobacteriota bacterium]
ENSGLMVYLGAEFHPPAVLAPEPQPIPENLDEEADEPQPVVPGQPTAGSPRVKKGTRKAAAGPDVNGNVVPPPKKPRKPAVRKRKAAPPPGPMV